MPAPSDFPALVRATIIGSLPIDPPIRLYIVVHVFAGVRRPFWLAVDGLDMDEVYTQVESEGWSNGRIAQAMK